MCCWRLEISRERRKRLAPVGIGFPETRAHNGFPARPFRGARSTGPLVVVPASERGRRTQFRLLFYLRFFFSSSCCGRWWHVSKNCVTSKIVIRPTTTTCTQRRIRCSCACWRRSQVPTCRVVYKGRAEWKHLPEWPNFDTFRGKRTYTGTVGTRCNIVVIRSLFKK